MFYSSCQMSVPSQAQYLKRMYPHSSVRWGNHSTMIWRCDLQPSEISCKYTIEIRYSNHMGFPKMYVISPHPLQLHPGESKLPHVYDSAKQQICVHFYGEWNKTMPLASTYVPWASRWLHSYETWLVTGVWIGKSFHEGEYTY